MRRLLNHPDTDTLNEQDPPYGAKVTFEAEKAASGWESPQLSDWLEQSVERASETYFRKKHCCT